MTRVSDIPPSLALVSQPRIRGIGPRLTLRIEIQPVVSRSAPGSRQRGASQLTVERVAQLRCRTRQVYRPTAGAVPGGPRPRLSPAQRLKPLLIFALG